MFPRPDNASCSKVRSYNCGLSDGFRKLCPKKMLLGLHYCPKRRSFLIPESNRSLPADLFGSNYLTVHFKSPWAMGQILETPKMMVSHFKFPWVIVLSSGAPSLNPQQLLHAASSHCLHILRSTMRHSGPSRPNLTPPNHSR